MEALQHEWTDCPYCNGRRGMNCDACYGTGRIPLEDLRPSILPRLLIVVGTMLAGLFLWAWLAGK